jgi:hypothetical protein
VQKQKASTEARDPTVPLLRKTTLGELGSKLPVGTPDPATSGLIKDISRRRWNLGLEKKLGKAREKMKTGNIAKFATLVLAGVCEQIGGLKIKEWNPKNKGDHDKALIQIGNMYMCDALYAYVWLRHDVIGREVDLTLTCPVCSHKMAFKADLETLEVNVADNPDDILWQYDLKHPITLRGQKCTGFKLGPIRWNSIENSQKGSLLDMGGTKSEMIWSAIVEPLGHDKLAGVSVAEHELEELDKWDLEKLSGLIDVNSPGPDMAIEATCPRGPCGHSFRTPIDWMYDSFFGISGRSGPSAN